MLHYVTSATRSSGTETNFVHEMRIPADHDTISLVSALFPKSIYTIQEGRNEFLLGATTYTVPEGSYGVLQLAAELNVLVGSGFCTFSNRLGKFTFTSAEPTLSFPATSLLHPLLGFAYNSTNAFAAGTLQSARVVEFQSLGQCNVTCNAVTDLSAASYDSLIASFPCATSPDYAWISWLNPDIERTGKPLARQSAGTLATSTIRFALLDEDSAPIDLHGLGVTLVLRTWKHESLVDEVRKLTRTVSDLAAYIVERDRLRALPGPAKN